MDDIEKRARAIWLLSVAHRDAGLIEDSNLISLNISCGIDHAAALVAIETALTPPEGWVLMPRVLTEEMLQAGYPADDAQEGYEAMIAARREVSP